MTLFAKPHLVPSPGAAPTLCAAALHLSLVALLLHLPRACIAPMRLPGTDRGTLVSLTYSPGRAPQHATLATARPLLQTPEPAVKPALKPAPEPRTILSANQSSPATDHPDSTSGDDAKGTGNVNIALAAYFPTPKPDLSPLPSGTTGEVVLEIVIASDGKVSSITLSRGLGHGVDEAVIATVQQWNFHPATRDGQPVASEQELHFRYEKA